jgi:putative transcriptional regulator
MTRSLYGYFADRPDDPALRLFAAATATLRADAGYIEASEDAAGGLMLEEEPPAPLGEAALERALARIEAADARDHRAKDAVKDAVRDARWSEEIAALPSPVREAAQAALGRRRWTFAGFGVRRLPLIDGPRGSAELMRVEPGFGVAGHDHEADELTLVLTGGYDDGHERYGPGDVSLAAPGFVHAPKAEPGEVCYVLALAYGPPRFFGLFRLVQRLLGSPGE